MSEVMAHNILLVDDEESILKALKRQLNSLDVNIFTASNGQEALKIIEENKISLIISDQKMPVMTGVEMLKKAKDIYPDSIRILLTGYAEMDATVDAINSGAIKYYFNKPWDDNLIVTRVQESLEYYSTVLENRRLQKLTAEQNIQLQEFNKNLESKVREQTKEIQDQHRELNKSFMETIKTFSSFIEMRYKDVGSHSQRVAMLVKNMIKQQDLDPVEYQDIVVAAYLHDIGKIILPDRIINKRIEELSTADKELIASHTTIGQSCVYNINGFGEIGVIIRNHHENYDGTGYPDRQAGDQISLGARIIRICNDFDHYAFKGGYPDMLTINKATAELVKRAGLYYDPELVKKFIDFDIGKSLYHDEGSGVLHHRPGDLVEGMILAEDIYTKNGMFLLPKGAKLSKGMISRINKINSVDPVNGDIKVYKITHEERMTHVPI